MCQHDFKKVNDCLVCCKCGLTTLPNGKIIFDRKIVNYKPKKRKKAVK